MLPMEPDPGHSGSFKLTPTQRWTVRITLVLFLFLFEKVVESALHQSHGDSVRQEMESLDKKMREELNSLSPWFLLNKLYEGMKVPVAGGLHAADSSLPAGDAAETIIRQREGTQELTPAERMAKVEWSKSLHFPSAKQVPESSIPEAPGSPPGGNAHSGKSLDLLDPANPPSGAEIALSLAETSRKEELTSREVPENPLTLIARIPAGCLHMISQSWSRGPIHVTLTVLLLAAAGFSLHPYTGRRRWLLLLVPPLAACFAAVLYFLCQGAAAVLGLSLLSIPSLPVMAGTAVAVGKIPFSMAVEKTVHRWLVTLVSFFR
jgi:hypothetical protein